MDAVQAANSGHPGAPMGMADIAEVLWRDYLKHNPGNPEWVDRDRFVLSAGHKCLALYGTLAEKGFFEESLLDTYGALCTKLGGHPDMHKLHGVESNTGALGHGLSISGGMAMGRENFDQFRESLWNDAIEERDQPLLRSDRQTG